MSKDKLKRAKKMCEECPFHMIDEADKKISAKDETFTCHMEDGPGGGISDIQCRGHWEARRKYKSEHK